MATIIQCFECFYCGYIISLYRDCEICDIIACNGCAVFNEWTIPFPGISRCFEHPEGYIEMKDVEETEL
jgi:hypothetical protein